MKYFTRTSTDEIKFRKIINRLIGLNISFVVDPIININTKEGFSYQQVAWELTVKIEHRDRLNIAFHAAGEEDVI